MDLLVALILWALFGAAVGWIASMIMGTDAEQGAVGNILLGIAGALVGGFLMNLFGFTDVTGINVYSFVVALVGAVLLVWVGRLFSRA